MKEEDIRLNFSKNLLALRKSRGLSQAQLAEALNYTDKAVSKWEKNETIPDVASLSAIAEYFDLTIDDLISNRNIVRKSNKKKTHIRITLSSFGICFFVSAFIFLFLALYSVPKSYVMAPFAFLASGIVLIVFASLWFNRLILYSAISVTIWSVALITMIFLDFKLFWVVLIIAFIIDVAFYPFLKVVISSEKKNR